MVVHVVVKTAQEMVLLVLAMVVGILEVAEILVVETVGMILVVVVEEILVAAEVTLVV